MKVNRRKAGVQATTAQLIRTFIKCEHGLSKQEIHRTLGLVRTHSLNATQNGATKEVEYGIRRSWLTAISVCDEIGLTGHAVIAVLLWGAIYYGTYTTQEAREEFGDDVGNLLELLLKVSELYEEKKVVLNENFTSFLLSFAEDVRVILILIADRLVQLRLADVYLSEDDRIALSVESTFLYAPLAHRIGLYNLKGEMEDLALKYTDRETYDFIKRKLNETKDSRDAYIEQFIQPVSRALEAIGLDFEIKGRTKSISSIRNKLKKQNIEFEAIYDLFAIRIILDCPIEEERAHCWRVYSIITDMYQPNPKRLKDWISIPKSNGYESLHITVMGPESKWVEVQIRSKRMDEVAEKGLAAHWRYKGVKSQSGLDDFMTSVRNALEQKDEHATEELIREFRLTLYDEEIYVFTPKGDLKKLPKGATVLDFAYSIHGGLGSKATSAKVNGKNVSIRHVLQNGDTVSIVTSSSQEPKQDWLSFVVTSRARSRIKQELRTKSRAAAELAREEILRRMRNRKLEMDEGLFTKLLKKKGYKATTDFYLKINSGHEDLNSFLDEYKQAQSHQQLQAEESVEKISADAFASTTLPEELAVGSNDVLVIDDNLTGIDYQLAKCCHPIYGDKIFAYTSKAGIKIHRMDCPNAADLFKRFGYRVLKAEWTGETNHGGYEVGLHIVGNDELAVVHNITSLISKESATTLRSYNIESNDGLFQGYFYIYVKDRQALGALISKIKEVKGVKSVNRLGGN